MTRQAVCLRCDWEGQSRADACPKCGVRLFRPVENKGRGAPWFPRLRARLSRPPAQVANDAPVVARAPRSRDTRPPSEASTQVSAASRRGAGAALIASAVILVGLAAWLIQRHTPAPAPAHTGEVGVIIYEANSADGGSRLYRWDLFANTVSRGPVVRDLVGLFDASAAHPGWVGETSGSRVGGVDIGVFKFLGPDDRALPLGHGDVAAWAPGGADAVVVTARPLSSGCNRLYVLAIHLAPLSQDPTGDERRCASLDGVQLSQRVTYLSLRGPDGSRVAYQSIGRLRTVLRHFRLDSLSPTNDMVVIPDASPGSPSPAPTAWSASLYFRGPASQLPTPYAYGSAPFVLDRVLAWDPNGTEALALGSAGGLTGFFRLDAAPPQGDTQPAVYISPAAGDAEALYTGVGTRVIFSGGRFSRVYEGSSSPLPLPPGAPVPTGPMVWVSA